MEFLVRSYDQPNLNTPEKLSCVAHEDEHFLVVNKPAGISTHAPSPYAGDGIYEFLRRREARWAKLAIIHRLDKETSGLIVFSKSTEANRSLTRQFSEHQVKKVYVLETDHAASFNAKEIESALVRAGERYLARPPHAGPEIAITRFKFIEETPRGTFLWKAEPLTGKTHQIRAQAAFIGIPICGDVLYGGTPGPRVCLHAAEITFEGPEGHSNRFRIEANFAADPREYLRCAIIDPALTNAYRLIHGATDGWPGWYVDRLGDYLLSQSESPLAPEQESWLRSHAESMGCGAAYHKILARNIAPSTRDQVSPRLVFGQAAPEEFAVIENGIRYLLSFSEGYSAGLFLDQRENRRRWLAGQCEVATTIFSAGSASPPEVLNAFAYTCGFSVCAAKAGARVTSLDLSRKYLDWGKRNFLENGIDPAKHDFIFGDVLDWFKHLAKKGRTFDAIILDPPTFSRSKESGAFRVEKDFPRLLTSALQILKSPGVIFASSNAAQWRAEDFAGMLKAQVIASGRSLRSFHYAAQPLDFPIHPREPAHLKTAWLLINKIGVHQQG